MNEQMNIQITEVAFKDFLFKNKRNITILKFTAVAILIQFAVFKFLYPYPSFIHSDSFSYLRAADENLRINTYLIGYSKFLRLFSVFFSSDIALVAFQYLFIQCSVLGLLFTLFYFYNPGRIVQAILLSFIVFNPLFLHLGNLVSSDGFFLGLSMIWLTLLIWIIHRPSNKIIIWHAVILFIAFTVRYNALIYPFISSIALWFSKLPTRKKLTAIGLGVLFCGLFIAFTSYQYKKLTGHWQYSPFSGWQLANNAMYTYRYVNYKERQQMPKKFEDLDNLIRTYFNYTRDTKKFPDEAIMASTYYMWSKGLPLFQYRDTKFITDTSLPEFTKWASIGPFYSEYGRLVIKTYPSEFIKYFLWPNANKFLAPPIEFLSIYNSGRDTVSKTAVKWFKYQSNKIFNRTGSKIIHALDFYPIASGIINLLFLVVVICLILTPEIRKKQTLSLCLKVVTVFWLLNASFTIFTTSPALRFQSFPIITITVFSIIFLDCMIKTIIAESKEIKKRSLTIGFSHK